MEVPMFTKIILGFAVGCLCLAVSLEANARGGGRDPTFTFDNARSDFEKRYPGDEWIGNGTARRNGPEKGAYIERCYWTARDTFLGLPWGFTQRCVRHTLGSTQQ